MTINTENHPAKSGSENGEASATKMQAVESSQIHSVGHNAEANTMDVWFKDRATGGVQSKYRYRDVTEQQFKDLLAAPSVGSHFKSHFQYAAAHPYTKIS